MLKEKKWLNEIPYFMLASLVIFFLITHSANTDYDSPTYIHFDQTRPLLYPVFIWLFHWAGKYQFSLVMWLQGIFLFAALLYARFWLRKYLQVADFPIFLVCLLVLVTISFHYQISYIQSEGLSFPLFILTFFMLVECFQKFHLKKIFYLSLLVGALVLTRLQFYYFYVIFALLCVWYLWQRISIKSLLLGIFILFGSMLLTLLIDHSYHYFKHGFFGNAPYSGSLIMVQTLYLADNKAANYFQDPIEKNYLQQMIDQRNAQSLNADVNLTTSFKPSYYELTYQSYSRNFIAIWGMINNTLGSVSSKSNAIATDINKKLIMHEPKKNGLFLLWKFVQCMGGIPFFLFFLILLLALPVKIIKYKIRDPGLAPIFVAVIAVITFLNAAIIAICNPDLPPYFCYSQFMFYCLGAFLVTKTL